MKQDSGEQFARAIAATGRDYAGNRAAPLPGRPVMPTGARVEAMKAAVRKAASAEAAAPPRPLSAAAIELGRDERGEAIGLDLAKLIDGRLMIQGVSGAGKSWTLRRLLEQSAPVIQQIVIDPEGEFKGLAQELGHLHVAGEGLDMATMATLAERVRAHGASIVIDLSQLDRAEQMKNFSALIAPLIEAPREHWTPALVAVDEAHLFAPFGGHSEVAGSVKKAAVGALTDLMSRGRKRGLAGIIATARLARLSKSVASEAQNVLIGLNTLDLDIKRAAETIGWHTRKAFDRLPLLEPGSFVGVGPAFSRSPAFLKVGEVRSRHIGAAPRLAGRQVLDPEAARSLLGLDELIERSGSEALDEGKLAAGQRAVRAFIRDRAFAAAALLYGALAKIAPDGATVASLAAHLARGEDEIAVAAALLDGAGVVEIVAGVVPLLRLDPQFARGRT